MSNRSINANIERVLLTIEHTGSNESTRSVRDVKSRIAGVRITGISDLFVASRESIQLIVVLGVDVQSMILEVVRKTVVDENWSLVEIHIKQLHIRTTRHNAVLFAKSRKHYLKK